MTVPNVERYVRLSDASGRAVGGVVRGSYVELHDAMPLELVAGRRAPTGASVAIVDAATLEVAPPHRLLQPLDPPEVWAAGVTYERSRIARREETEVADVYSLVYGAERPELFLKDAGGRRTVGPGEAIGVRADSAWTVPEAELALVLDGDGSVLALTIGNDVTARDIEAKNPLYLPQAKIFASSCALGPALIAANVPQPLEIGLAIRTADGTTKFSAVTSTRLLRRTFLELASFAFRHNPIPAGSVLLTGTGIVPPDDVALVDGDVVDISLECLGTLRTPVRQLA